MCTVAFGLHQGYGHKIDGVTHAWPYIVRLRPNIYTGPPSAVDTLYSSAFCRIGLYAGLIRHDNTSHRPAETR
jgi:hypothetical protein